MNKLFLILQRSTNFIELVEAPERPESAINIYEVASTDYVDTKCNYYYCNLEDWTEDIDSIINEVIKTTGNYLTFDDVEKCKNFLKQNLEARFIFMTEKTIEIGSVEHFGRIFMYDPKRF